MQGITSQRGRIHQQPCSIVRAFYSLCPGSKANPVVANSTCFGHETAIEVDGRKKFAKVLHYPRFGKVANGGSFGIQRACSLGVNHLSQKIHLPRSEDAFVLVQYEAEML